MPAKSNNKKRCAATTKIGKKCSRFAILPSKFCKQHSKASKPSATTTKRTKVPKQRNTKAKQPKKDFTIHYYIENEDLELECPLSLQFIDIMQQIGVTIKKKIGKGGMSDVFLVDYRSKKDCVMILLANTCSTRDVSIIDKVYQTVQKFKKNYYYKIEKIVYSPHPYSNDPKYCNNIDSFSKRPILIGEYVPYTVESYIEKNVQKWSKEEKSKFLLQIQKFLNEAESYLVKNGAFYPDLKLENLGVTKNNKIVFLDIEGTWIKEFSADQITKYSNPIVKQEHIDDFISHHVVSALKL
jgi:hypothetical protein